MKILTAQDVVDYDTLAEYARQRLGTPRLMGKAIAGFRGGVKQFLTANPQATYYTLTRLVDYCVAKKIRPKVPWGFISLYHRAWADGWLTEFEPVTKDPEVEAAIADALAVEDDPEWRARLYGAQGADVRKEVLERWQRSRTSNSPT